MAALRGYKLQFFRDAASGYRWRLVSTKNGKTVADAGQGYTRKVDCKQMAFMIFDVTENNIVKNEQPFLKIEYLQSWHEHEKKEVPSKTLRQRIKSATEEAGKLAKTVRDAQTVSGNLQPNKPVIGRLVVNGKPGKKAKANTEGVNRAMTLPPLNKK